MVKFWPQFMIPNWNLYNRLRFGNMIISDLLSILPGPTSRTIYMEPSVIVHWVPLIWSSDIRSFRCYGQFYAGPICQWLLSKIYWKDGHSGFMVKFCLVPPWNIYPESSVLRSSPLWHLCPAHYSLPRPASPSAVVGVSYLHPHLLARSD